MRQILKRYAYHPNNVSSLVVAWCAASTRFMVAVRTFAPILITVLLTACGSASSRQPDPFTVTRLEPLEIPASFELRDPAELAAEVSGRINDDRAHRGAYRALFDRELPQYAPASDEQLSATDRAFLEAAGAMEPDRYIRYHLEVEYEAQRGVSFPLDFLVGRTSPVIILDTENELGRLERNTRQNRPVTSGSSPTIRHSLVIMNSIRRALRSVERTVE